MTSGSVSGSVTRCIYMYICIYIWLIYIGGRRVCKDVDHWKPQYER